MASLIQPYTLIFCKKCPVFAMLVASYLIGGDKYKMAELANIHSSGKSLKRSGYDLIFFFNLRMFTCNILKTSTPK